MTEGGQKEAGGFSLSAVAGGNLVAMKKHRSSEALMNADDSRFS